MIQNSKGKRYFGLHFYPGVAEYQEAGKEPYRVFLNEDTLRAMDKSFEGCPVFVMHVDGVEGDIDVLRAEADGWVLRSFYNEADGKHWCEFLTCSDRAEKAIARGMRLSNCYLPKLTGKGGLWNGVPYAKEITAGEYEHLAIVPNPRYDESVILTPEEFKRYNEEKTLELKRMSNEKEGKTMLEFFTKKVEKLKNSADLEGTLVVLPKSKREVSIATMVNELDLAMVEKKEPQMANGEHLVEHKGAKMTVNDLLAKHDAMCQELDAIKNPKNDDTEFVPASQPTPVTGVNEVEPEEHEEAEKKALELVEHEAESIAEAKKGDKKENDDEVEEEGFPKKKKSSVMGVRGEKEKEEKTKNDLAEKKRKDAEKAERLRNAPFNIAQPVTVEISDDQVRRGKTRYGS